VTFEREFYLEAFFWTVLKF